MRYGIKATKTPVRMANLRNLNNYGPATLKGIVRRDLLQLGLIENNDDRYRQHRITEAGRIFIGVQQ